MRTEADESATDQVVDENRHICFYLWCINKKVCCIRRSFILTLGIMKLQERLKHKSIFKCVLYLPQTAGGIFFLALNSFWQSAGGAGIKKRCLILAPL